MSLIDEDDDINFVIPPWNFEVSLILHLLDVLNEQASICVHESIANSLIEICGKKISFTSKYRGIYMPGIRYFVSPLVSNLIVHHMENGMGYAAIAKKYGITVRSVMRRIQAIKRVSHED